MLADMSTRAGRRHTDPELTAPASADETPCAPAKTTAEAQPAASFEAQRLGQPGLKRGLRGGAEVLTHARSAYLETEYSGAADRRPPRGVIARKKV